MNIIDLSNYYFTVKAPDFSEIHRGHTPGLYLREWSNPIPGHVVMQPHGPDEDERTLAITVKRLVDGRPNERAVIVVNAHEKDRLRWNFGTVAVEAEIRRAASDGGVAQRTVTKHRLVAVLLVVE